MMPCYIYLYTDGTVHPPGPILHSSVRPDCVSVCSVGLFVQLRLLRGDKNDLATCHAPSETQLKLQFGAGAGVGVGVGGDGGGAALWPLANI